MTLQFFNDWVTPIIYWTCLAAVLISSAVARRVIRKRERENRLIVAVLYLTIVGLVDRENGMRAQAGVELIRPFPKPDGIETELKEIAEAGGLGSEGAQALLSGIPVTQVTNLKKSSW